MSSNTLRSSLFILSISLPIAMLGLSACNKEKPEGTTPPDAGGGASADAGGGASGGGGGDAGSGDAGAGDAGGGDTGGGASGGGGPDVTQTVCDAQISEDRVPMFADEVIARLPKNVAPFVEDNPFFFRMSRPTDSVSCVEGLPGATITWAAAGKFVDDPKKDIAEMAKEAMTNRYGPNFTLVEESKTGSGEKRTLYAVVDVPEDAAQKAPPAKTYLTLKSKGGQVYWLAFEVHPNTWNAMRNTLAASAKAFLVVAK